MFNIEIAAALARGEKVSPDKINEFVADAKKEHQELIEAQRNIRYLNSIIEMRDAEIELLKAVLMEQEGINNEM